VKVSLTEVRMSRIRKISDLDQEKKTYKRGDRVTVLGVVWSSECDWFGRKVRTDG
jgi:hypothetical protein